MERFVRLVAAIPEPPVDGSYAQDLVQAIASAVTLVAVVLVIYLIFRATYRVIKLFAECALYLTMVIFIVFVLIGWLNC